MPGNCWEWCRDHFGDYDLPVRADDGFRYAVSDKYRVARGGCFYNTALQARSAYRYRFAPEYATFALGIRPARPLSTR